MFKKVKSLMVAGLLVMGMAVPAFASPAETKGVVEGNFIEKMNSIDAKPDTTNGIYVIERNDMIDQTTWDTFMRQVNENDYDGLIITGTDGLYEAVFDENFDGEVGDSDEVIATVKVDFSKSEEKGIFDITPGTGDAALAVGGIAVAAAAVGALVYVNKKEDKDEE